MYQEENFLGILLNLPTFRSAPNLPQIHARAIARMHGGHAATMHACRAVLAPPCSTFRIVKIRRTDIDLHNGPHL